MKRSKDIESSENPFSLSIGDLMAGVLFIFVLLLASTMLDIQQKAEADAEIANQYNNIKAELFLDIAKEFHDDLASWNAVVDSTDLAVRFLTKSPSVLVTNTILANVSSSKVMNPSNPCLRMMRYMCRSTDSTAKESPTLIYLSPMW